MTSTTEVGLGIERIRCPVEVDLHDLLCSTICEDVLWKPVACQQCETHFCSKCITRWLQNNPDQCPLRCDNYIQRPCSKFIARQLAKLQVVCINQSNGCNEIISYDALEKHEMNCVFQRIACTACHSEVLQKDMADHRTQCSAIVAKCPDCNMIYQREHAQRQHSDMKCLQQQFENFRKTSQTEIDQLKQQLLIVQNEQVNALLSHGFVANNRSTKRTFLAWTEKLGFLDMDRIVSSEDSPSVLNENLICLQCHNIFWKPVCCEICGTVFCAKCRPRQTLWGRIGYFFTQSNRQHPKNHCDNFQEGPVPDDILFDLGKLQIRCAFAPNGCQVVASYYDLEQHESECEFEKVPCEICQLPISNRSPIVEHTLRICFEEMERKNPAPIQQQFITLMNATEETEAENRRLRKLVDKLEARLTTLDSTCLKKPGTTKN